MKADNPSLDGEVISTLVCDLISLRTTALLPKIEALNERKLIYYGITGDYPSIKKDISELESPYDKRKIKHSIFDRYEEVMTWHGYRMRYDEVYKQKNTYSPPKYEESVNTVLNFSDKVARYHSPPMSIVPVRTEKKIGRNEPCPCGSGKKYKKCCLKK